MKAKLALLTAFSLVLAACSATRFSVPAVTEHSDGSRLPGKIIWHDLLTDTPDQTRQFYSGLFGWEFEAVTMADANYTLIRHRGELIGGMIDQNLLPTKADISQWVVVLSVTDVEQAVARLRAQGGTVFTPPTSLGDRGTIAVVADSQGALLALLQTTSGDPPDRSGPPAVGDFLWDELWAADPTRATSFYRQLAPYHVEQKSLGPTAQAVTYTVLSVDGKVRAGIRPNPVSDMPPMWVSYLRVEDVQELDRILARVESLGGRILAPAMARPAGGRMAVIAGPSGAGIALQTWADDQRLSARPEQ